ncbi:MAG TPA: hypothetical protein VG895_01190 [Patescibacteria group bacterium]|nr:hypothetical protein [Patescibacteria group bacterium]
MSDAVVEQENSNLTNKDIVEWLKPRQSKFSQALQEFARKSEYFGFQKVEAASNYPRIFQGRTRVPDFFKRPTKPNQGEFTGSGLCGIASGVLERALIDKYGQNIDVIPFLVRTDDLDIDTGKSIEEGFEPHAHTVLVFKTQKENDWYLIDSTYRQFQMKVKPDRFVITPFENINKLYSYEDIIKRSGWKQNLNSSPYAPQPIQRNYLYQYFSREIAGKTSGFDKVSRQDYDKLLESLN